MNSIGQVLVQNIIEVVRLCFLVAFYRVLLGKTPSRLSAFGDAREDEPQLFVRG